MTMRTLSWQGADDTRERDETAAPARAAGGDGRGDGVAPVCIGVVVGPLRAELACSYLEQAGISVYLQGASVAGAYGLVGGPLGEVRVFVPAAQSEEAARIFSELDFSV
jgi:hypothetical protein